VKKLMIFACMLIIAGMNFSIAQTATSVATGSWTMPTTWDCNCVPTPGYTVTINHIVTLSSDWAITSGSITIGPTGALDDDGGGYGMLINSGGTLNVVGSFTMAKLAVMGGTITNTGIITDLDSLYLDAAFENFGVVESSNLYNAGNMTNEDIINTTNFYNNGGLLNYSGINSMNFNNADTCENYGEIFIDDFTNMGYVNNKYRFNGTGDFLNMGEFYNVTDTAYVFTNDILNKDSVNHDAVLLNWGSIFAGNNFVNYDLVTGNAYGFFCTGNYTANYGNMVGDFTFDDNTPPATEPYIDYNSGTLDPLIVWIADWCFEGIPEASEKSIHLYPNPVSDMLYVSGVQEGQLWKIFTVSGTLVMSGRSDDGDFSIGVGHLPSGTYMIATESDSQRNFFLFTRE
jgi:hypothetical protein